MVTSGVVLAAANLANRSRPTSGRSEFLSGTGLCSGTVFRLELGRQLTVRGGGPYWSNPPVRYSDAGADADGRVGWKPDVGVGLACQMSG
jgi:hypothetical protein